MFRRYMCTSRNGMRRVFVWFSLFCVGFVAVGQESVDFFKLEQDINNVYREMSQNISPEHNRTLNNELLVLFDSVMSLPQNYSYAFDSLMFAQVKPRDKSFRIFSWFFLQESGRYDVYAILQRNPDCECEQQIFTLHNSVYDFALYDSLICDVDSWFPACYYEIVEERKEEKYIVLGWNPYSLLTQYKVVEVLSFKDCEPVFGHPVFVAEDEQDTVSRVIFNYSAKASMLLKTEKMRWKKMIISDNLVPSDPDFEGVYEFYGPDGSYNGYVYDGGLWHYMSDVDISNKGSRITDFFKKVFRKKSSAIYSETDEFY
jgi:hypothetical protein